MKKFTALHARKLLPKRSKSSHKASAGKTLIVAGSRGMYGAGILAATAAARVGSGYVQLHTDTRGFRSAKYPDFLLSDYRKEKISENYAGAVAIGPGLGTDAQAKKVFLKILKLNIQNLVIDADALNLLSVVKKYPLPKTWIATPHEGELSRILGIKASEIHAQRKKYLRVAQKKLGCIVLLKGHRTLIADSNKVFEIRSGNAALAKAGTGDVLTGMIAGFLAQGLAPREAACLAAFVHGHMADEWLQKKDILSLMASDLLALLPHTLKRLR